MQTVFVACFAGGAVATALFALLGGAHAGHLHVGHSVAHGSTGHLHTGAHGHAGHTAAHGGHLQGRLAGTFGWGLSWISPLTIAAAALWFGGIGLLTGGGVLGLLLAVIAGLVGAALVRLAMNAFVRASSPPLVESAEGAIATVNAAIRPGAPGEVIYTLEGLHRSLPARSVDGSPIPRGVSVVITRREGGFAWVERLDPLEDPSLEERSYT